MSDEVKSATQWGVADAAAAIPALSPVERAALAYLAGDHWQRATGWNGPQPRAGESGAGETLAMIERAFTVDNVIGEVIERHAGGVAGREVAWSLALDRALGEGEEPTPDEQALIEEAEAALTAWWDERDMGQAMLATVEALLPIGRAPLRFVIPPGRLEPGPVEGAVRIPRRATPGEALALLHLDLVAPTRAAVYAMPDTRELVGVYLYERDGAQCAEMNYAEGDDTVLRLIERGPNGPRISEARLALGRRLMHHELRARPLVDGPLLTLQRSLNKSLTMMGHNQDLAGFLERTILNGQMPGEFRTNARGEEVFVSEPVDVGAGTSLWVAGLQYKDESGNTRIANPQVVYREPVAPDTFLATQDGYRTAMLRSVGQLHIAMGDDATASGASRIQARGDYLASLRRTVPAVERATRWIVETALALAAEIIGQPGRYEGLRAVASARLDAGPVSPQELAEIRAMVEAGLWSREEGMTRSGVDDPDAMAAQIESETPPNRADIAETLFGIGGNPMGALVGAGYTPEEASAIVGGQPGALPFTPTVRAPEELDDIEARMEARLNGRAQ